jgi:hypothetical protein
MTIVVFVLLSVIALYDHVDPAIRDCLVLPGFSSLRPLVVRLESGRPLLLCRLLHLQGAALVTGYFCGIGRLACADMQ